MFSIASDPSDELIQATLSGFLDVGEVRRYAAAIEPVIRRAAARGRGYAVLLDISGCAIQAQEVVTAFQQHLAAVPRARRCAVVTGASIVRMQARRLVQGPSMRIFEDKAEALVWLGGEATPERTGAATAR